MANTILNFHFDYWNPSLKSNEEFTKQYMRTSSEYTQGALPLGPPLKASGRMKRVWGSELYEQSTPPLYIFVKDPALPNSNIHICQSSKNLLSHSGKAARLCQSGGVDL